MRRVYIVEDDPCSRVKLKPVRTIGSVLWSLFKGFLIFLGVCVLLALL